MNQKFIYKIIVLSIFLFGFNGCKNIAKIVGSPTESVCLVGNCDDGEGVSLWADGSRYSGEWRNGEKDGFGRWEWNDRREYIGYFDKNSRHGFGVYSHINGAYIGEYKNNREKGYGIYVEGNKTYAGLWVSSEEQLDSKCFIYPNEKEKYSCLVNDGMTLRETVLQINQKYPQKIKDFRKKYPLYIEIWVPSFNE